MKTSLNLRRLYAAGKVVVPELFRVALVTFLTFTFFEEVSPGFVSRSLQPTMLFTVTVVIGIVSLPFLPSQEEASRRSPETRKHRKALFLPLAIGLVCTVIVYARLRPLDGTVASVAGAAAGVLVFLLGAVLPRFNEAEL